MRFCSCTLKALVTLVKYANLDLGTGEPTLAYTKDDSRDKGFMVYFQKVLRDFRVMAGTGVMDIGVLKFLLR